MSIFNITAGIFSGGGTHTPTGQFDFSTATNSIIFPAVM